jgi:Tfp pilus assembly protein PilX
MFTSCQEGCGSPDCGIRNCAKEKAVEVCALCESYPCHRFTEFLSRDRRLAEDNLLLREKGWEAWAKLQDERSANGFVYIYEKTETKEDYQ